MTNLRLHTMSKTVNGLRKIAWASVFAFKMVAYIYMYVLKWQHIHTYIYIYDKPELTEFSNFRLFAANGKWKFVFLGRKTINSN
jgi:hypothetical protein